MLTKTNRETVMIMLDSHTREDITTQKTQKTLEETRNACYTILEGVSDSKRRNALILNALKPQYTHIPSGSCEAAPTAQMYRVMQPADVDRTNQRILRLLRFRGMESRFEQIPQAYAKTFEWVYGPSTSSSPAKSTDADGSNTEKWANFTKWLGGDESLYWITGKAGAGKSTLMRFLYRDERTREGLSSWSCDRPLTMPYFFFWNSGERIQMSYEGLLRTLAYQVLQQMPHLIPIVFPHRVEATILLGVDESEPWTCEELFRGFRILLRSATETNSLILFIDGMDEFEGEASTLIDFVTGLLECGPYIKVCASSRPWQVFKDSFGHHPHLKVEDLTFGDINCYVTSKLGGHLGFQAYQRLDQEFSTQLIENVCLKSSGVFLWVSLVTRSLLEGLSEGENLSSLQKRLDDLPPELEDLSVIFLQYFSV